MKHITWLDFDLVSCFACLLLGLYQKKLGFIGQSCKDFRYMELYKERNERDGPWKTFLQALC